jgi:hypothetical protein
LPDWEKLIRSHLDGLDIDVDQREEIAAELADHLEDVFSELRRRGIPEEEAFRRALDEIPNGKKLRRRLRRAALQEDAMSQRVKYLWIPGLFMLALTLAGLSGAIRTNMYLEYGALFGLTDKVELLIYLPWLVSLPLIGALGAYWSMRMGGDSAARVRACLFPVAVLTVIYLALLPVTSFWIFHSIWNWSERVGYLASCALSWVAAPAALLFLGALPFLRGGAREINRPVEVQN